MRPPPTQASSPKSAEAPRPVAAPEAAPKGYLVQLGVFSDFANAQQLQQRLSQHGIKSYTETRLHVGPFNTKEEAEQSLAKLRSLGISAVIVPNR
ncbi:MAG: SPOR domain-containing protein [Sulfuricellaceae bacterium]|nr:SPOR domain-containing protein [Sulfuricellaceae bacterium]